MQPNILYTHMTMAAAMAYLMVLLQKSQRVPWIREETARMNAIVRGALAAVVTLGISWTWAPSAAHGHVLTIAFPSGSDMLHGAFSWFGQYAVQHGWEKLLAVAPPAESARSNKFDSGAGQSLTIPTPAAKP